jgi:hypothetical protein
MTTLRTALDRYVNMRQGFGYKFQKQARLLTDFVSFMGERKATTITTKLAVAWQRSHPIVTHPGSCDWLLSAVSLAMS